MAAAVAAVEDGGINSLTVTGIVARARVARKTFYDIFNDSEDCILAACEQALDRAQTDALRAYEAAEDWRAGIRAAILAILELIDQERGLARICIVDAPAAGERVLERREQHMRRFASAIDIGRQYCSARLQPPPLTARAAAAGVHAILHSHLLAGEDAPVSELAGSLTAIVVMPYLGRAAAGREYARAAPARSLQRRGAPLDREMLSDLNVRMTYRTIQVLRAVREHPGASNRDIAGAAGITDQGQISKLLKRLAGLELVENLGDPRHTASRNAWHLTDLGARVQQLSRLP